MALPSTLFRPRGHFFGKLPASYERWNGELLELASVPATDEPLSDRAAFLAAASTGGLDRVVKVLPLPVSIPSAVSTAAILGMERLRERGVLTALRGNRPTDLARPNGGEASGEVRRYAPGLIDLVEHVEGVLRGSHLFVRAIKLDASRASTTAPSADPAALNLHFDAERSSLIDYPEPVFQFYLNAGQLERQFRILPVARDALMGALLESEGRTLPFREALKRFLARHSPILETIPVESGALAVFDGRQFAHDAGKCDPRALATGRFEPSSEPDLVLALDTVETGYHQGFYWPELPFFEDKGAENPNS